MIYLLRHGDAEDADGTDDASRRLTEKGRRQALAAGRALSAGRSIDACLSSPRARALETAELACEALGLEPEPAEELNGGPFNAEGLAAGRGDVLLVGHEPDFSNEVARLTGARTKLKKGSVAIVDGSTLLALLRPRDLAASAALEKEAR